MKIKRGKVIIFIFLTLLIRTADAQLNVEYFMNKGRTELFNDENTQAIQTFNTLIRSRPDLSEPHLMRGLAKYNLGDYRGAEFDFTRCIMLDAYNPNAYHYRGVARSSLFDYYNALDDFKKSIARRPNNPYVYLSRGATKMQMKNYKEAIIDFDTVILYLPDLEVAFLNRAIAKSMTKNYEGAIKDCNSALKLNFFYVEAYAKRGSVKSEMGDFKEAMKDFDQAIKIDDKDPRNYFLRGAARINSGDTTGALEDFGRVIKLDPLNDLTFYNRALIMLQQKQYELALADLNRVLEINPENVYTWYNRGYAKIQLSDYIGAIDDFTHAIEIFPDFAAAYMSRSSAKQELKDHEGARKDYDLAIAIINAMNSEDDYGPINRGFKADSVYLQKIIEFEADFNSNNVAGGRIQNRSVYIQLKPNFTIQYYPTDSVIAEQRATGYEYRPLNKYKFNNRNFSFNISPARHTFSEDNARYVNDRIDSVMYFDPFSAENYFRSGTVNSMLLNFNEALIAFNRATELNPRYVESYFNRANIIFELAEHQFSMEESTPKITISKGVTSINATEQEPALPDFSRVLQDYDRVIQLDPTMSYAWYNRGNIKNRMRDFEGALHDYTIAVGLQPNFAEAFYNRALTLIYLKNTTDACLDLSTAGELGIPEAYNVIKRYCNK